MRILSVIIWLMAILVMLSLSGSPASAMKTAAQSIGVIVYGSTPLDLLLAGAKPDTIIGYGSLSWLIYRSHAPDNILAKFSIFKQKNPFEVNLSGELFDLLDRETTSRSNYPSLNPGQDLYLIQFIGPTKKPGSKKFIILGSKLFNIFNHSLISHGSVKFWTGIEKCGKLTAWQIIST